MKTKINFHEEELIRYNRHFMVPQIGFDGQKKLKASKVLVVGAGGLGSPLLFYLAAAGIGTIGIVDDDTVAASNLQRQILYETADIGKPKAEAAKKRLAAQNPYIDIVSYPIRLTSQNALEIFKNYDVIVDGTDNFSTRYLVNDASVFLDKPNVYGSVFQFEGQVSVFNFKDQHGIRGPTYRCLYPSPPAEGLISNCAEAGVLGILPGIIGSLQANEVIKIVVGIGKPLSGKLLIFDSLTLQTRILPFKRNENIKINFLTDYTESCHIQEITVQEFKKKRDQKEDFQLIDVREENEYRIFNLGGILIPLNLLEKNRDKIARDRPVIIHCKGGGRSLKAIQLLQKKFGFTNLYNLKGGIEAYIRIENTKV